MRGRWTVARAARVMSERAERKEEAMLLAECAAFIPDWRERPRRTG